MALTRDKREVITELLYHKFYYVPDEVLDLLSLNDDEDMLYEWVNVVLDAQSLHEVVDAWEAMLLSDV